MRNQIWFIKISLIFHHSKSFIVIWTFIVHPLYLIRILIFFFNLIYILLRSFNFSILLSLFLFFYKCYICSLVIFLSDFIIIYYFRFIWYHKFLFLYFYRLLNIFIIIKMKYYVFILILFLFFRYYIFSIVFFFY